MTDRFKAAGGVPLVTGRDFGPFNAGPLWIWNPLRYDSTADAVTVHSPMMKTPMQYKVKLAAGFHYCKLLAPSRALEWLYVDGLRLGQHKKQ